MKFKFFLLVLLSTPILAQNQLARWQNYSKSTQIIRDTWGIPHIYGKTDADAVFGLLYAQCEDDFARVEMNYIEKLGRMAEVKGENALAYDLYIRLILDQNEAKKDFQKSPAWLKKLLTAYADGINYYLVKHPNVKPKLIQHFEPWFPLLWTDGSIGAISTGDVTEVETGVFYGLGQPKLASLKKELWPDEKLTGSNGFAVGPKLSSSGNAMLYINPHVTFYFRPEVHMNSESGLNTYGAVTWGQFFIYQGFNQHGGWMHTSSEVDVADSYIEKTRDIKGEKQYFLDGKWIKMKTKWISLQVKGKTQPIQVKAYFTHRGPILASRNGNLISVRSYNRSLKSLIQSWARTKTKGFSDFKKVMEMRANTSNNTVYADDKGNIAYWHGNFIPKRNPSLDWGQAQDGTRTINDWKGLHTLDEIVHVYNPVTGWIQNCNSTPFTVSGTASPLKSNYPIYMAPDGENFRDRNAVRLFSKSSAMNLDELISLGYDRKLMAFEVLIPRLVQYFDQAKDLNIEDKNLLKAPIDSLRKWNMESSVRSIAQTLAVRWGLKIMPKIPKPIQIGGETDVVKNLEDYSKNGDPKEQLMALKQVILDLQQQFSTWQLAWGEQNRFQRISNQSELQFDDTQPSIPVPFTSSAWGQLPSYTSKSFAGTKNWYGVNGNSFVCAVEFGSKLQAKSILAGGQSGNPLDPHFFDQAKMYSEGKFKEVFFYKVDVLKNQKKLYRP